MHRESRIYAHSLALVLYVCYSITRYKASNWCISKLCAILYFIFIFSENSDLHLFFLFQKVIDNERYLCMRIKLGRSNKNGS